MLIRRKKYTISSLKTRVSPEIICYLPPEGGTSHTRVKTGLDEDESSVSISRNITDLTFSKDDARIVTKFFQKVHLLSHISI